MESRRPNEKTPLLNNADVSSRTQTKPSKDHQKDQEEPQQTRSSSSSCLSYLSTITVEPTLFLHCLSYGVEGIFKTNLFIDKTCSIQLNYSDEVCKNLDSGKYNQQQDTVQQYTTKYNLYCTWIEYLPAVFVIVLLGAWSDTRGRRLPLLLPSVGFALKALGFALNAYWWSLQPYYILLSFIPYGLSGSMMAVFMGAYAYIGEDSSHRSRTTRLSFAGVMMYLSMPIGHGMGAFLFSHGGYVVVFGVEFILAVGSVIYVLIRFSGGPPSTRARESELEQQESGLWLSRVKQTLKVVLKKRERRGRAQILGHIACMSIYVATFGKSKRSLYIK